MYREEGRRLVQTAMSGGLTLMISQCLCQWGLSQQVEGNMSASEAVIRQSPAAIHTAVWLSFHVSQTHMDANARKDSSLSNDDKSPRYSVCAIFIHVINPVDSQTWTAPPSPQVASLYFPLVLQHLQAALTSIQNIINSREG